MPAKPVAVGGYLVRPCLARQARKLSRAKVMIRRGVPRAVVARRVGWTDGWLRQMLAAEKAEHAEYAESA